MNEKEREAVEWEQEQRAAILRAAIEAGSAETDRLIREQSQAIHDSYDATQAEHEAAMRQWTGGRNIPDLAADVWQWRAELQQQQVEELFLKAEDVAYGAVDVERAEMECHQHCVAAIAAIDAELERQRHMETDEDGEMDAELAAELRQQTEALACNTVAYGQSIDRLRKRVAEEAERQKKAWEVLKATQQVRQKRTERCGL